MAKFTTFFLICITTATAVAQDNLKWKDPNTIIWTTWDNPPVFISSGKYIDQGFTDKIQKHMIKSLTGYTHQTIKANIPRILKLADMKANTCNASWLDTPEWRKSFYFSIPYMIVPTNGVIVTKQNRHKLPQKEPISFEKLIAAAALRLGVARLYGEGLDEILFKYDYKNNPMVNVANRSAQSHLMLKNGRVDYILGYPFEVVYYKRTLPGYDPVSIAVMENTNSVPVVFGCVKTPWGKKVVEQINKVLKRPGVHEHYQEFCNDWLEPDAIDAMASDYKKFVQKYYSRNKQRN
jgi:uncharacterized protein (TIGR02285 family)